MNRLVRYLFLPILILSVLVLFCSCLPGPAVGNDVTVGSPTMPSNATDIVPSATPSRTASPTPSATSSPTPSHTVSPTLSATPSPAPSRTPSPTQTSASASETLTEPTVIPDSETPLTADVLEHALSTGAVPVYTYRVVNTYPHDSGAFTQGLVYEDGLFYEGTGLRGRSSLRKVDAETGQVLQFRALADLYFGEGIAVLADQIYQLTWKSGLGFVYDKDSFGLLWSFSYPGEGWGLTHDGQRLIMSDGTPVLRFLDPETLQETGRIQVTYEGHPVWALNELEHVQGEVYANIWKTNTIARIDPQTGRVIGLIDLEGLLDPQGYDGSVDVLNGIAYDAEGDRLFVTGKLWPILFEIELVPQEQVYFPILVLAPDAALTGRLEKRIACSLEMSNR